MAEKIKIDIAAAYDDKQAKQALKDAEKLDSTKVEMEIDADVDRVLKAFDQVESEAKEVAETAEMLARALGPELTAKADPTAIVNDLRQMGLTMDQIKGNADQLGAKLKELSDADVGGKLGGSLGTARGKMDDLGKSADSSRSVLANMVGNATQDIGALAGVSGSAGVAIGQMGEYMLDARNSGEGLGSVLKNFAQVAGPIAAISAGIFLVSSGVAAYNKPAKEAEERTKALGKAMQDSADDSLGFADVLRENQDALSDFIATANDPLGGFGVWVDETMSKVPLVGGVFKEAGVDIFDTMRRANLSVYDFGKAIDGTQDDVDAFKKALDEANRAGRITDDEMRAGKEALDKYGASAKNAAENQGLFNVDAAEADAILKSMADPLTQLTGLWDLLIQDLKDGAINSEISAAAINTLSQQLGINRDEVIQLAAAEEERRAGLPVERTEQEKLADAADNHRNALARLNTEAERVDRARLLAQEKQAADELKNKYRDLHEEIANEESLLSLKRGFENMQAAAETAWTAVNEGAEDAEQAVDDHRGAWLRSKDDVLSYIESIEGVPDRVSTSIEILYDQGDYDQVLLALERLSKPRTVEYRPILPGRPYAAGSGYTAAGRALVGEDGPEIVDLPAGARVYPASVSSAMMHSQQSAPMVVNINMPRGSRGVDVLRQVSHQARRSGRRYGTPVIHYARTPV